MTKISEELQVTNNGTMFRELVKIMAISAMTAGMTTYITVQALVRDVSKMELAIERLSTVVVQFNGRLTSIETKADERGPRLSDHEARLRTLELSVAAALANASAANAAAARRP